MAYVLKYCYGHDALAAGVEGNEKHTLRMLCEWAQVIICMRPEFKIGIPAKYHRKVRCLDVGRDVYFNPHPELVQQAAAFIEQHEDLKTIVTPGEVRETLVFIDS